MDNDSKGIHAGAPAVLGPALAAHEREPGDFSEVIGYESANPSLQGPQWFEAMQGQPTPWGGR